MKKSIANLLMVILFMASFMVLVTSCKKETQTAPAKNITLKTDSVTQGQLTLIFENKDTYISKRAIVQERPLKRRSLSSILRSWPTLILMHRKR